MKDDSGYAFPTHGSMGEVVQTGMTLRDYFAAKALSGLLMSSRTRYDGLNEGHYARLAYAQADAMIKERGE
jgi:hypothetical protein